MIRVKINTAETGARTFLVRLAGVVSNRRPLNAALTQRITDELIDHFRAKNLALNQLGGARTTGDPGACWHNPEPVDNRPPGVNPFREHPAYQDEQVVLRGTGGNLTMIAASTGLGSTVAELQERVSDEIAQAEAEEISALFQQSLDPELLLQEGFGDAPPLAYWELAARDEQDQTAFIDGAVKLRRAGYEVAARQIAEVTGYQITTTTQPTTMAERAGAIANRLRTAAPDATPEPADEVVAHATTLLALARQDDLAELDGLLRDALRAPDAEVAGRLQALLPRLPDMVEDADAATEVWQRLYAAAMVEGFSEGDAGRPVRNNCGTGAGGFQSGNKCQGRGKGTSRERKQKPNRDVFGPKYRVGMSPEETEERLTAVIDKGIRDKSGMHRAAWREGLGRIDVPWGTPGDKSADFKGGSGLSHIIAKHGEADARKLPAVLAYGAVTADPDDPAKRIVDASDAGFLAVLVKEKAASAWVLTAYTRRP